LTNNLASFPPLFSHFGRRSPTMCARYLLRPRSAPFCPRKDRGPPGPKNTTDAPITRLIKSLQDSPPLEIPTGFCEKQTMTSSEEQKWQIRGRQTDSPRVLPGSARQCHGDNDPWYREGTSA
jgi:hypothetical protein